MSVTACGAQRQNRSSSSKRAGKNASTKPGRRQIRRRRRRQQQRHTHTHTQQQCNRKDDAHKPNNAQCTRRVCFSGQSICVRVLAGVCGVRAKAVFKFNAAIMLYPRLQHTHTHTPSIPLGRACAAPCVCALRAVTRRVQEIWKWPAAGEQDGSERKREGACFSQCVCVCVCWIQYLFGFFGPRASSAHVDLMI